MEPPSNPVILAVVYAIHDFHAENPDELSFVAGEAIRVTEKDDQYGDGWWQGLNAKGDFGLFPQAYTLPDPTKDTVQPTMNETLHQVQNAIDRLHHPSTSSLSLFTTTDQVSPSSPSFTQSLPSPSTVEAPSDTMTPKMNSAGAHTTSQASKARALLAQKTKPEATVNHHASVMERLKSASNHLYPNQPRASLSSSSISIPDIGDIELSEESGDDDDHDDQHRLGTPNRSRGQRRKPSGSSVPSPSSNQVLSDPHSLIVSDSTAHRIPPSPAATSAPATSSLASGPFSAAAIALGLAQSPQPNSLRSNPDRHYQRKTHKAHASTSSILSEIGLDLREHYNHASPPLASALRMSRESSQPPQQSSRTPALNRALSEGGPQDGGPVVSAIPAPPNSKPLSPLSHQEFLVSNPRVSAALTGSNSPSSLLKNDLHLASLLQNRQRSASSVGSGVFFNQQSASPLLAPTTVSAPISATHHYLNEPQTANSATDSSSIKGSRSRSSSRTGRLACAGDDQLTSPATSSFPSLSGAQQGAQGAAGGDGSLASSLTGSGGAGSRVHTPYGIKSNCEPNDWSVSEVVEWGKVKGLDELILNKFMEHEITGDVLLEFDMNSLKEIDLVAFGRRVKVIKAIDELRRAMTRQNQPHHSSEVGSLNQEPLSPAMNGGRLSGHSNKHIRNQSAVSVRADLSAIHYRTPQAPLSANGHLSDREEEIISAQGSQRGSRSSAVPLPHDKRPSIGSNSNRQEGHEPHATPQLDDEAQEIGDSTSSIPLPSRFSGSSAVAARPRQATFSNAEGIKSGEKLAHMRCKSLSSELASDNRASNDSAWTPLSLGDVEQAELRDNFHVNPPEHDESSKSSKKTNKKTNKKSVIGIQKPPMTANSVRSKKSFVEGATAGSDPPSSPEVPQRVGDLGSGRSRTSFLGNLRGRKPPPKIGSPTILNANSADHEARPGSSAGPNGKLGRSLFHFGSGHNHVQGQTQHQIHHLTPLAESKNLISSPLLMTEEGTIDSKATDLIAKRHSTGQGENRTAVERIGKADHQGWMRKKGEKYPTWKMRYFVLKGPTLYYLKSPNETKIKGLIKLSGFKVVMDGDVNPGRYGFKIIHDNGATHSFSADDSKLLRDWMKSMMKATIDRDWAAPVISSCNIKTIPIREAQKIFPPPRPPSPTSRAKVQKARLVTGGGKNNPEVLTEKDAAVLMSLQNFQTPATGNSLNQLVIPSGPIDLDEIVGEGARPGKSVHRTTLSQPVAQAKYQPNHEDLVLIDWVNEQLKNLGDGVTYEIQDFSESIRSGKMIVRLVESLTKSNSGLEDEKFEHGGSDEEFEVYFCVFDYLNQEKISLEGYSLNDMISGNPTRTKEFLTRIREQFDPDLNL